MSDHNRIIPRPSSEKATDGSNVDWISRDEAGFNGDGTTAGYNYILGYSSVSQEGERQIIDIHRQNGILWVGKSRGIHWPSLLIGGSIGAAAAIILTELLFR
jgi:hypothetical protein